MKNKPVVNWVLVDSLATLDRWGPILKLGVAKSFEDLFEPWPTESEPPIPFQGREVDCTFVKAIQKRSDVLKSLDFFANDGVTYYVVLSDVEALAMVENTTGLLYPMDSGNPRLFNHPFHELTSKRHYPSIASFLFTNCAYLIGDTIYPIRYTHDEQYSWRPLVVALNQIERGYKLNPKGE